MFDSMIQQARGVATSGLSRVELEGVVAGSGRVIAALSALQTRCATEIEALEDGGVNSKTVLREAGRMSTRSANTVAKTAAGLAEMPKLAESLADGAITVEHAAVAVAAAAKTSAEQVEDELSKLAETSSVDVFTEQSRRWVNRNQPDDGAELDQQQRHNRLFKHWVNEAGMGVLLAELDPTSYQQAVKAINVEYDRMWRDDGGRDGTPDDVRTTPQRLADAFVALISDPGRRGPGSTRMQLIAVADIERLRSDHPTGVAEIVGGEALPQTVLERLMCIATVTGVVFDGKGQPIWVGRDHRFTPPKLKSKPSSRVTGTAGAADCAAGAEHCEIHHIVPWEQGGLTDIDKMCLACSALPPQHPRPRLHRHQNQHRLQNHQPQQPTKRPLTPTPRPVPDELTTRDRPGFGGMTHQPNHQHLTQNSTAQRTPGGNTGACRVGGWLGFDELVSLVARQGARSPRPRRISRSHRLHELEAVAEGVEGRGLGGNRRSR